MSRTESRRLYPRQLRRLAVRYWREGEDRARQGFTRNVSLSGALVSSPDPAGRGERLRVELSDAGRTSVLDAVVVHSHRVPGELHRVADSAMGLRFLGLDELVGPFLSAAAQLPREEAAGGPVATYALAFATGDGFLATYRRDLLNGGLFVTTDRPARLHDRVAVDLRLPGDSAPTVRIEGRVVQVVDPRPLASGRTAGGMGLELLDRDAVISRLAAHVAAYER